MVHVFDPTHSTKGGRNFVKDKTVKSPDYEDGFRIQVLYDFWVEGSQEAETLRALLAFNDMYPTDVMDIDPLKNLFNAIDEIFRVSDILRDSIEEQNKRVGQQLFGLARYLSMIKTWYQVWQDYPTEVNLPMEMKLEKLEGVVKYFESLKKQYPKNSCTKEMILQLRTSVNSLRRINEQYKSWFGIDLPKLGHIGTNANENHFSIIR